MKKPNIVVIYADDLGYGDVSCYGAADIQTPNIDKLAENGIQFTSGYSTSAVCTPARFSLLTGSYPFRNKDTQILPGNAGCIIPKDCRTLPKILKEGGYTTGVVGKWHLGIGDGTRENGVDWNQTVDHTPNDLGFDHSFIFPGTNDRVPCVYLKNRNVLNLDPNDPIEVSYAQECPFDDIVTYAKNPEKLRMESAHGHNHSIINGVGRIGFMRGGEKATWKDEDLAERFLAEAKGFMDSSKEKPFFLFYALHQPHVPRLPMERFKGKSKLGVRGDVILELDWCVGEITKHLEEKGILEDTMIIFSSDNGPVLNDGYKDGAVEDNGIHRPAGGLRGGKYSKYDGGARVPFIVSWKGQQMPRKSDAILSQVDFSASFASMLGITLGENDCPDSENMIDLLTGKNDVGREETLFESMNKAMVLRRGQWEYLEPSAGAVIAVNTQIELGNAPEPQLYNMLYDRGQREDVMAEYPEIGKEMAEAIEKIKKSVKTR